MPEMIKPSFEKMAFMGEKAADSRFVNRVDITKDKLNVVLNPIDPVAERKINGEASVIVKGLAESGEWSCDSVKTLVETVSDPTRSANRNVAKERLDILANSMYIVMTHGKNEALQLAVGTKDGAVIDAALPDSLKGIGGMVAEISIKQEITNPKLKGALKKLDRRAEVLRASGTIGEEKLRELVGNKILELSDLVEELDDRGYEELTRVSAYLGVEADKMVERAGEKKSEDGEGRMEIPKDPEMQLAMVRETLNALELSGNQTREFAISQTVAYMEKIANLLDPEVALEVRSRLKLIDCYVFMKMADGRIDPPKVGGEEVPTIGVAAARARGQNHALDRDSIKFFLETKDGKNANGLPIAKAWDLLQEANFNYGKFLKEVVKGMPTMSEDETKHFLSIEGGTILDDDASLGKVDTNYFTDPEVNRRAEVRKYMIKVLGDNSEAEKAVELADKLALATAETSIFNKALTGNDQLAEDIYFKKYRTSRKSQGRNRGATIHQEEIDGLGTSWLRRESKVPIDQMMKSDQIHFDNIAEGSYNYFFPVWVSAKIHPLRNHLTDEAPNPKEILAPGYFKNVVDFFNKADPPELMVTRPDGSGVFKEKEVTVDQKTGQKSTKEYVEYNDKKYYVEPKLDKDGKPEKDENGKPVEFVNFGSGPVILEMSKCGRKDLRTWWALGVVQQALAFPELGWDPVQSLLLLEREMVKEKLSEEAGGFLSPEQWKWVVEQKVYWNGKKWLNAKEGALKRARNTRSVEFSNSILSGGLGGKKRR